MSGVWPDPDPGWRVRMGVGLVEHMPMSDAQRKAIADETERERLKDEAAAKLADELKFESDAERDWYLQRHGLEKRTVADVLQAASLAGDRQDRRDKAVEERAAVELGKPPPRRPSSAALLTAAKAEREAREAAEASTPATVAELGKVKKQIQNLKHGILGATGHKIPL